MTAKLFSLTVLAAAGFGLMSPLAAHASTYAHIDRLALRLERQTAELHREVHLHFRPTPIYAHLDRDVAEMEQLARHIHDVACRHGCLTHLRHDVEELDRLYHHIEDLVRTMSWRGALDCHARRHFERELNDIGDTLHHLRDDLEHMTRRHSHHGHRGGYHGGHYRSGGFRTGIVGVRVPIGDHGHFNLRFPIR